MKRDEPISENIIKLYLYLTLGIIISALVCLFFWYTSVIHIVLRFSLPVAVIIAIIADVIMFFSMFLDFWFTNKFLLVNAYREGNKKQLKYSVTLLIILTIVGLFLTSATLFLKLNIFENRYLMFYLTLIMTLIIISVALLTSRRIDQISH